MPDGTYEPSSFTMAMAVKATTDFKPVKFDSLHTASAKVLVVCTDDGKFKMANGKVFNSGNHPTELLVPLLHFKAAGFTFEFATVSGGAVVLEMWAFPTKDAACTALYEELKPLMERPAKLEDMDAALAGYAGVFLPGGHGAMVNLPDSPALGKVLHAAHKAELPTIAVCHGPAALLAAGKSSGDSPYSGYKMVTFSDKTDQMTPKLGYIPGHMPWLLQDALRKAGAEVTNTGETGATRVDRELIPGDSVGSANAIGQLAAPLMVAAYAKRTAGAHILAAITDES